MPKRKANRNLYWLLGHRGSPEALIDVAGRGHTDTSRVSALAGVTVGQAIVVLGYLTEFGVLRRVGIRPGVYVPGERFGEVMDAVKAIERFEKATHAV